MTSPRPRRRRERRLRTAPALLLAAILLGAGIFLALAGMRFVVAPAASAQPSAMNLLQPAAISPPVAT